MALPSKDIVPYSGNLSISLSNVARLLAHPKFVWVFNVNCDGTIIYNDSVLSTWNIPQDRVGYFFNPSI
jgi:hypothetical protein